MNEINVCFLTDDGYAMPTCIAMKSMLDNKNKNTKYNIYILSTSLSEHNTVKFKELNSVDFEVKIVNLEDKYKDFYMNGVSASPTAIYKFSIPEILSDLDKVIYLDGDIIVNSDLLELYNYKIGKNYIGAVKDINGALKRHYKAFIKKGIFYFNSGVMIMNLKQMRKDKITEKLIDYRLNGYNELMDQDALNYVLRNKTCELPFKYNTQTMITAINKKAPELKKFIEIPKDSKNYDDIINNSLILHYSLKNKPWKSQNGYKFDKWLYYYYQSPFGNTPIDREKKNIKKSKGLYARIQAFKKNGRRLRFFKKFKSVK